MLVDKFVVLGEGPDVGEVTEQEPQWLAVNLSWICTR